MTALHLSGLPPTSQAWRKVLEGEGEGEGTADGMPVADGEGAGGLRGGAVGEGALEKGEAEAEAEGGEVADPIRGYSVQVLSSALCIRAFGWLSSDRFRGVLNGVTT